MERAGEAAVRGSWNRIKPASVVDCWRQFCPHCSVQGQVINLTAPDHCPDRGAILISVLCHFRDCLWRRPWAWKVPHNVPRPAP